MNVYQCWYRGLRGYCCRSHNYKWMFVPEMGQSNNAIQKHISIHEIVFNSVFVKQYELEFEQKLKKLRLNPLSILFSWFWPEKKSNTVGGLLFAPTT